MTFDWTCPFCQKPCTITDSNVDVERDWFSIENKHGPRVVTVRFLVCPNSKCKEFTLDAWMSEYKVGVPGQRAVGKALGHWALVPPSSAKVFPDFVPSAILGDYREACAIQNLSPKASATLSRRCLQGMIRDFWGIKKSRLVDEIEALEKHIDPLTWKAMDAEKPVTSARTWRKISTSSSLSTLRKQRN